MDKTNLDKNLKQRMLELEEKQRYYKLKRREKNELKELHKKFNQNKIINKEKKEKKAQEIKNEINKRQYNLRTGKEVLNEKKSDNIELIEKIGKEKGLSSEEIKKEIDKTQILEDMSTIIVKMRKKLHKLLCNF